MSSIRVHVVAESTRMLAARAAQAADRAIYEAQRIRATEQPKGEERR